MSLSEENSNGFPNVEEDVSKNNDEHDGDEATPFVPSGKNWDRTRFDFNFDFDRWMGKYVRWTDEKPMLSRCVVSAITASVGVLLARATTTGSNSKLSVRSQIRQNRPLHEGIDVLEAISFAVHGGLVAGPLSYYIDEFLNRQRQKREGSLSESKMSSSTYDLLIDEVVMAPPKLYLTFLIVDVTKTLLKRALPDASRKSIALLASALSDSLRFWPLSIYVLLKFLKKRRHYAAAINLCSIAFSMHLAKKRNNNIEI